MVTTNGQIYKIDTNAGFIDIRQAFLLGEGKVVFQFRNYDKSKPKGARITKSIDFYMLIDEFLYFCEICKTGMIYQLLQNKVFEAQNSGKNYPSPGYMKLGGTTTKAGKVISRQFRIEGGNGGPIFFKALQGPGKKTETGMISPCYKDNDAEVKIVVKIDDETLRKVGLMGEKAIDVFYIWSANGKQYLEEKCKSLAYTTNESARYEHVMEEPAPMYEQAQQMQPNYNQTPPQVLDYNMAAAYQQYPSAMEAGF